MYSRKRLILSLAVLFAVNIAVISLAQSADALAYEGSARYGDSMPSNEELMLARLISAEAGNDPYSAQVAVGAVVINRMRHPAFPNTMAGVIYEAAAFQCVTDGSIKTPPSDTSIRAAHDAICGTDPTGGAVFYYDPIYQSDIRLWSRPRTAYIGRYRFCT